MNKSIFFIIMLFLHTVVYADDTKEPSIKVLDWMIGEWKYSDKAVNSDYTDEGSRVCQYALMDQYILCEMKGMNNSGKKRNSHFYINYNNRNQRYEMVAVFNDFGSKNLFSLEVSKDGKVIDMTNNEWGKDELKVLSNSQITYDGDSTWLWKIRVGEVDPVTKQKPVGYIDTATRVK